MSVSSFPDRTEIEFLCFFQLLLFFIFFKQNERRNVRQHSIWEGDVFTSFLSPFLRFLCGDKKMLKMEEHVTATREKIWLLNGELRFLLLTLFLVLCYTLVRLIK